MSIDPAASLDALDPFEEATPTTSDLLTLAIKSTLAGVRVSMPAYVTSYDRERACVTVQPVMRDTYADGTSEVLPPIPNVPIRWPVGAGFSMTHPIDVGDEVMITMCDRSIRDWLTEGSSTNRDITAQDGRRHTWPGAWCVPGVEPFAHVDAIAHDDRMFMGSATISVQLTKTGKVRIGSVTVDLVSIVSDTLTELIKLVVPWNAFLVAIGVALPAVAVPAATLATAVLNFGVAANILKAFVDTIKE